MPHYWRGWPTETVTSPSTTVALPWLLRQSAREEAYAAWVNSHFGTTCMPPSTPGNGSTCVTQVGGTIRVLRLIAALYDDAPVALARKKARPISPFTASRWRATCSRTQTARRSSALSTGASACGPETQPDAGHGKSIRPVS